MSAADLSVTCGVCRVCGGRDQPGPASRGWAELDLCSACAPAAHRARLTALGLACVLAGATGDFLFWLAEQAHGAGGGR